MIGVLWHNCALVRLFGNVKQSGLMKCIFFMKHIPDARPMVLTVSLQPSTLPTVLSVSTALEVDYKMSSRYHYPPYPTQKQVIRQFIHAFTFPQKNVTEVKKTCYDMLLDYTQCHYILHITAPSLQGLLSVNFQPLTYWFCDLTGCLNLCQPACKQS